VQGLSNNMVLKEIRMAYLPSFRFLKVSAKVGHIVLETEVVSVRCSYSNAHSMTRVFWELHFDKIVKLVYTVYSYVARSVGRIRL
jgi:hypothetical protein